MFEFLKKLNREDKIKKLNNGNSVNYVASKELRKEINNWIKNTYLYDISFGEILYKLGFPLDKTLYLERVPDKYNISIRYGYDKDITGNKRIDLSVYTGIFEYKGYMSYGKKITLSGDGYKKTYTCIKSPYPTADVLFDLVLVEDVVTKYVDSTRYNRVINLDGFKISLKNLRTIRFDGVDLVIKSGYYDEVIIDVSKSGVEKINNEDKLIDYLGSITKDEKVEEIYRKICDISLGEEDEYKKIDLILNRLEREEARLTYSEGTLSSSFTLKVYHVIDGDRNYTYERYFPNKYNVSCLNYIKIVVTKGDYSLVLMITPKDYVYGMKLNNELELRDYLSSLEFPISIEEVYKKICEISLGDVSEYTEVEIDCYYGKDSINILSLCLENGEFKSYKINRDGKEIFIDDMGKFSYVNNSKDKELSIDMNGDIVTKCQFVSETGIESDNMGNSIYNGINEAKDVKVRTRKMIDKLIKKR